MHPDGTTDSLGATLRIIRCYHRFMRSNAPALAPVFRSQAQGEILARLLLRPEAEWSVSDLARGLRLPLTTVQDEVSRLITSGILTTRKLGRSRLVQANAGTPLVDALTQLVLVTFGPQVIVAEEFARAGFEHVVIFGSWAARYHGIAGQFPADIDVLVLVHRVDRSALYDAAKRAEDRLMMPVNPVVREPDAWQDPSGDPLLLDIQANPYVELTHRDR